MHFCVCLPILPAVPFQVLYLATFEMLLQGHPDSFPLEHADDFLLAIVSWDISRLLR